MLPSSAAHHLFLCTASISIRSKPSPVSFFSSLTEWHLSGGTSFPLILFLFFFRDRYYKTKLELEPEQEEEQRLVVQHYLEVTLSLSLSL